jgi:hypothetical protein
MGCVDPPIGDFDDLSADIVVREGVLEHMGVSLGADFADICK